MDRRSFLQRTAVVVMGIRALDGKAVEEAFTELVTFDDPTVHIKLHSTLLSLDEAIRNFYMPVMVDVMTRDSILLTGMLERHTNDRQVYIRHA